MTTTKYNMAIIFTKHTNLLQWLDSKVVCGDIDYHSERYQNMHHHYEQEREVQLILLVRYDDCGNLFCKIKCPVNPLPIRGEFNSISLRKIVNYIITDGWTERQRLSFDLLK